MIPEPRSRLCFLVAAVAALGAPFLPDASAAGRASMPWVRTGDGMLALGFAILVAAAGWTGAWTRLREDLAASLCAMAAFAAGFFALLELSGVRRSAGYTGEEYALVAVLGTVIAPLVVMWRARDPAAIAALSRASLGGLCCFVATTSLWSDVQGPAWVFPGFGLAGVFLLAGELLEGIGKKGAGPLAEAGPGESRHSG